MGSPHVMAAGFPLVDFVHPSQYLKITIKHGRLACPINHGEQKGRIPDVRLSDGREDQRVLGSFSRRLHRGC